MFGGLVHMMGGLVKASLGVVKSKLKNLQVLQEQITLISTQTLLGGWVGLWHISTVDL